MLDPLGGQGDQKMLDGIGWATFFNNDEYREDIVKLVPSYFQTNQGRNLSEIPVTINAVANTQKND